MSTANRMQLTTTSDHECTIEYTDYADQRVSRTFWAPRTGGYVREISRGQGGTASPQVCERLAGMGNTLRWRS